MDFSRLKKFAQSLSEDYLAEFYFLYSPYLYLISRKWTVLTVSEDGYTIAFNIPLGSSHASKDTPDKALSLEEVVGKIPPKEPLIISIPESYCFTRQLHLPQKSLPKIKSILELDMLRVTPFSPTSAWSFWLKSDNADSSSSETVDITQYILRKDILKDLLEQIAKVNSGNTGVIVRGNSGDLVKTAIALDGLAYGIKAFYKWLKLLIASLSLVIVTVVLFFIILIYRQDNLLTEIDAQRTILSRDVADVQNALAAMKAQSKEIELIEHAKVESILQIKMLDELSTIIPGDTYLENFSVNGSDLLLEGHSPSPEKLISLLEASPLLKNVSFSSPVITIPGENLARFSLKANLETEKALQP